METNSDNSGSTSSLHSSDYEWDSVLKTVICPPLPNYNEAEDFTKGLWSSIFYLSASLYLDMLKVKESMDNNFKIEYVSIGGAFTAVIFKHVKPDILIIGKLAIFIQVVEKNKDNFSITSLPT